MAKLTFTKIAESIIKFIESYETTVKLIAKVSFYYEMIKPIIKTFIDLLKIWFFLGLI